MNKDLLYYFDKTSPFQRHELGEMQSGFNFNFVIDGTKDSAKVVVKSFNGNEIEPNTIIWHEKTDTWLIVSRDKVERHLNDSGFCYYHNIQLEGAFELLNARDLTDCGFNQNEYTNGQFIRRLFKLSNFEFPISMTNQSIFTSQIVKFVKTFENYTLASALREFLDGFNMCGKLLFHTTYNNGATYLDSARLMLINKTGDNSLPTHDISEFDDVREIKTIDKNSFGSTVISNAENVISSQSKTYPSTGSVRASGTEYRILAQNGIIRLPSKVYKANWLKIVFPCCYVNVRIVSGADTFTFACYDLKIKYGDKSSLEKGIQKIIDKVESTGNTSLINDFNNSFQNEISRIKEEILLCGCATLYNGNELNPENGNIIKGANVPYLVNFKISSKIGEPNKTLIFCDEETKNTLPIKYQGIQWKRGSNEITGFDAFVADTGHPGTITVIDAYSTDIQSKYQSSAPTIYELNSSSGSVKIYFGINTYGAMHFTGGDMLPPAVHFIVNYIPMIDLKVKVDNQREKRDIQLYNQNGKLTDNIALSKLLNSYSKEISSDKVTKYKVYRNYNLVPKVGSFVTTPNGDYVVNNVSMDFAQSEKTNEDFGYFIDCEINMSKYCAAKSLMVNPNTNIRDYGIPQNFNVKRKQIYRDYYELSYSTEQSADTDYYLEPSKVFDLDETPNEDTNFICVIRLDYDEQVENSTTWYYQLETTVYGMNKMLYVVCDFNDNNIIGYASQNVYSGFDISRVFSGSTDDLNTPISYVDGKGKVKDIRIKFCDNEQLTHVYDTYQQSQTGGDTYEGSLYNYSCFIPSEIYEWLGDNDYTFLIEEHNYNKDAIEVPVFEYACQIEDSDDVLIGDDIFPRQKDNVIYMYSFVKGEHLTQNNVIAEEHISYNSNNETATLENAAIITLNDNQNMSFRLFEERYFYTDDYNFGFSGNLNFEQNKDYAIFRHTFDLTTHEETNVELVFIAKKVQPSNLNSVVNMVINHWKLN